MHQSLFLFLMLLFTLQAQDGLVEITPTNNEASATTTYTIFILQQKAVPITANTIIQINFPIQYQEVASDGTYTCSPSAWIQSVSYPTLTCSMSGLTMAISGGFPSGVATSFGQIYEISIEGIRNPLYAQTTSYFTLYFKQQNSNIIFSAQSNYGSGILISEGLMQCTITSNPTQTNKQSVMIITITPPVLIPYGTTLSIVLNKFWPRNSVDLDTVLKQPINCLPVTGVSASITCTLLISTNIIVSVSNIIDADTTTPITFSISPMINPPTVEPQGVISVYSKKNGQFAMAKCQNNKITGITSNSLEGVKFSVQDYTVNAMTKGYLEFTVHSYIKNTDSIIIQFPEQISLGSLSEVLFVKTYVTDYTPSISNQIVTIEGLKAVPMNTVQLQMSNIKNPGSEAITSSFKIQLTRNTYTIEQSKSNVEFSARRGALSGSVSAISLQIGKLSDYSFEIQFENPLQPDSKIIISIPTIFASSINIGTTQCHPACDSLTKTVAEIAYSALTVTNNKATVQIKDITNPLEVGASDSFIIKTLLDPLDPTSIVDEIVTGMHLTFIPSEIINIGITSDSDIVYNSPTKITISADNQVQVEKYSSIQIQIPSTLRVSNDEVICQIGASNFFACSFDQITRILTISSISTINIAAHTLDPISIGNVFNPPSTKPTASFKFYILNVNGQITHQKTSGLIYAVSTPSQFSTLSLIPNNNKNSEPTSLLVGFSIYIESGYTELSTLVLNFPQSIIVSSASCTPVSSNLQSVSCTKNTNQIKAKLSFVDTSVSLETSFKVEIYDNYPSIESYSIQSTLFLSPVEQYEISKGSFMLINSILSAITVDSYSFSQSILGVVNSLTFEITPKSNKFKDIVISFPSEFILGVASCSVPTGTQCSIDSNRYIISPISTPYTYLLPIRITLNNIQNPTFTPSTPLTIQTVSDSGSLQGQDLSLTFQTSCTLPCRTCSADLTHCLSCYSDALLVSGKTLLDNNQCKSACSNGFYFDTDKSQCEKCSISCELCVDFNTCTSCPTNKYLHLTDNTCLDNCPPGYYEYSNQCQGCNSALYCETCQDSISCETCEDGYFLYESLCLVSCPTPITYPNSLLKVCSTCPVNCTQCSGDQLSITCLKCESGYLMDNGRCYLECVTIGTVPSGNQCVQCSNLCLTCSGSQFSCDSCDPASASPYHFGKKCLSTCPDKYYNDQPTKTCQQCPSPCQLCTSSSVNSCLSCISDYFLLGSSCLSSCIATYYEDIYQCKPCQSPCEECTSKTACKTCETNYYLYGQRCVTQCDPGMTVVNGNQCLVCDAECKSCSTASYCTSCFSSNYLYNGDCSITCPSGTFPDSTANSCLACVDPCQKCSSASSCITCLNENLFIENNACVASCTIPLIPINSVCVSCDISCETCEISITNCLKCSDGYFYFEETKTCDSVCSYFTYQGITNQQCKSQCPPKHFADENKFCKNCPALCQKCSSQTNCQSCDLVPGSSSQSYVFYKQLCYEVCPDQAPFNSSGKCFECSRQLCEQCMNDGTDSCKICKSGNLLISYQNKTICIEKCETNELYNSEKLECQEIPEKNSTTNNTNTTDNKKNDTEDTGNTDANNTDVITPNNTLPNNEFSFISKNGVPNFIFLIGGAFFAILIIISKAYTSETNILSSILTSTVFLWLFSLGNIASYEVNEMIAIHTKLRMLESVQFIPMDNLTTLVISIVIGLHVIGMIITLISLCCINDYALKGLYEDYPAFAFIFTLLIIIDYRFVWVCTTVLFGFAIFKIKFCKKSMVILLKFGLVIGLLETLFSLAYSAEVIRLVLSKPANRLLLSQTAIDLDNLYPYIEFLVLTSVLFLVSIGALFMNQTKYYIEQGPKEDNQLSEQLHKTQNYDSMNELISEKDAIDQRFNQSSNKLLADFIEEDYLNEFQQKSQKPQPSRLHKKNIFDGDDDDEADEEIKREMVRTAPMFSKKASVMSKMESQRKKQEVITRNSTKRRTFTNRQNSRLKVTETHDINIQVNLDQIMLPVLEEDDLEEIQLNPIKQPVQVQNRINEQGFRTPTLSQNKLDSKQNKQQSEEAKSQPSWAEFKLGSKYKQQIKQQTIYLGYVHEEGEGQIIGSHLSQANYGGNIKKQNNEEQSDIEEGEYESEGVILSEEQCEKQENWQKSDDLEQSVKQEDISIISLEESDFVKNKKSSSRAQENNLSHNQPSSLENYKKSINAQQVNYDLQSLQQENSHKFQLIENEEEQKTQQLSSQQLPHHQNQQIEHLQDNLEPNQESSKNPIESQNLQELTSNISSRYSNLNDTEIELLSENIPQQFRKIQSRLSEAFANYQSYQPKLQQNQQVVEETTPEEFIFNQQETERQSKSDISEQYVSFYSERVSHKPESEINDEIPEEFQPFQSEEQSRISSKFNQYPPQQPAYEQPDFFKDESEPQQEQLKQLDIIYQEPSEDEGLQTSNLSSKSIKSRYEDITFKEQIVPDNYIDQLSSIDLSQINRQLPEQQQDQQKISFFDQASSNNNSIIHNVQAPVVPRKSARRNPELMLAKIRQKRNKQKIEKQPSVQEAQRDIPPKNIKDNSENKSEQSIQKSQNFIDEQQQKFHRTQNFRKKSPHLHLPSERNSSKVISPDREEILKHKTSQEAILSQTEQLQQSSAINEDQIQIENHQHQNKPKSEGSMESSLSKYNKQMVKEPSVHKKQSERSIKGSEPIVQFTAKEQSKQSIHQPLKSDANIPFESQNNLQDLQQNNQDREQQQIERHSSVVQQDTENQIDNSKMKSHQQQFHVTVSHQKQQQRERFGRKQYSIYQKKQTPSLQYDDASHFNELNNNHQSENKYSNPSELGASLLLIDDNQDGGDKQSGILYEETNEELDEYVKTPIRQNKKIKNHHKEVDPLQQIQIKPSELLSSKGKKPLRKSNDGVKKVSQLQSKQLSMFKQYQQSQRYRTSEIIYEQSQQEYDGQKSLGSSIKKSNVRGQSHEAKDRRPSQLLEHVCFTKIGSKIVEEKP